MKLLGAAGLLILAGLLGGAERVLSRDSLHFSARREPEDSAIPASRAAKGSLAPRHPLGRTASRVWTVGGPGSDFPLIAPALHAASPGDEVRVRRGVYREDLVLERTVALVGEGRPVLIGTGQGTVVTVRAPNCRIRGFRIEGSGLGESNLMDAAVAVYSSGNVLEDNDAERVFYGIVLETGSGNVVEGNRLAGLAGLPFGRRGDGIYAYRSPDNRIEDNSISGMRDGLYLQYSPRCAVLRNRVEECRYALHDMYSNDEEISGNEFSGSSAGANVMNCRGVRMVRNRFAANRGIAAVGLSLKECDRAKIEENEFLDNARGLQIQESSGNRFAGNRFRYNDTAIDLSSSAEDNVFTANDFEQNLTPVVISGGASSTRWSENGAGNFWSDYRGFDFDGKGIGREPHPVASAFERLEGNNPAARLFLASPAASALAFAARGVLPGSDGAIDRYPLVHPASSPRRRRPLPPAVMAASAIAGLAAWRARRGA